MSGTMATPELKQMEKAKKQYRDKNIYFEIK